MPSIKYVKPLGFITLIGGLTYISYETHKTYSILNSAIDTSVIDIIEPTSKISQSHKKYVIIEKLPEKSKSLVDRFWDRIAFRYAHRLINIAQSEKLSIRRKAVDSLSKIQMLDNWHYSLLAHMLDARTAVGLARSKDVDVKFFLKPPEKYLYYNHERIVSWMKHFLISLNNNSYHPCLEYFLKKAFVNPQEVGRMVEHDISSAELKQCIQSADDILPLCVESILHHSTIENNARDIVQLNGLPLLIELHKRYKDNIEITVSLAKIIANISLYPEFLQDLYRSGWIGVLAKFLKNDDIRISGAAAKALANLDSDDEQGKKFERKMYLLHPIHRCSEPQDVDVIIVHGLLGGVFFTWRQRDKYKITKGFLGNKKTKIKQNVNISPSSTSDPLTREYIEEIEEQYKKDWDEIGKDFEIVLSDCPLKLDQAGPFCISGDCVCAESRNYTQCWPKDWLPYDCPYLRVIGINYDTNLSFWAPVCPLDKMKSTLNDRSDDFIDKLLVAGVGNKPIIWITHSMGGLLVKNMLVKAWQSEKPEIKNICNQTKGIIFYSTPHKGTHVASLNQTTSLFLWPSIEVRELKEGSPILLKLHKSFLNLLKQEDIKVLSFAETESTTITPLKLNFHFVPEHSSKLDFGEHYDIPLDHLRICKPINRFSFLYQKVLLFVKDILKDPRHHND